MRHNVFPRRLVLWLNTNRHFLFDSEYCTSVRGFTAHAVKQIPLCIQGNNSGNSKGQKNFSTKRKMFCFETSCQTAGNLPFVFTKNQTIIQNGPSPQIGLPAT